MKKRFVAGNWKMFKTLEEAARFAKEYNELLPDLEYLTCIIPPAPYIGILAAAFSERDDIHVGAQNCHFEKQGAFTGEISSDMVETVGGTFILVGHSERRMYFHEDDAMLAKKVDAILETQLTPIFCCGESLEVRDAGKHFDLVKEQLTNGFFHLPKAQAVKVVIAYEPVWAIGTGRTATAEQAQEMHAYIRSLLQERYDQHAADNMFILYGGSVKPNNAKELFSQPDVDGGLVGGASLDAKDFVAIATA